jgi:hypothetical protein
MKPGSTFIIECQYCGQYAKKKTLLSGNTFGAELWSDGKIVAPMLPEFPSLVLCKKCNQFYWVEDAREIERMDYYQSDKEGKWSDVNFVEFPTFNQYFDALETIPEEEFIRINIWWSYNDFFRKGIEDQITPDMHEKNTENLAALLKILCETDDNDLLIKSEAYRNLGFFDESKELLNRIEDPDLTSMKDKLLKEINNHNKGLIRLY